LIIGTVSWWPQGVNSTYALSCPKCLTKFGVGSSWQSQANYLKQPNWPPMYSVRVCILLYEQISCSHTFQCQVFNFILEIWNEDYLCHILKCFQPHLRKEVSM